MNSIVTKLLLQRRAAEMKPFQDTWTAQQEEEDAFEKQLQRQERKDKKALELGFESLEARRKRRSMDKNALELLDRIRKKVQNQHSVPVNELNRMLKLSQRDIELSPAVEKEIMKILPSIRFEYLNGPVNTILKGSNYASQIMDNFDNKDDVKKQSKITKILNDSGIGSLQDFRMLTADQMKRLLIKLGVETSSRAKDMLEERFREVVETTFGEKLKAHELRQQKNRENKMKADEFRARKKKENDDRRKRSIFEKLQFATALNKDKRKRDEKTADIFRADKELEKKEDIFNAIFSSTPRGEEIERLMTLPWQELQKEAKQKYGIGMQGANKKSILAAIDKILIKDTRSRVKAKRAQKISKAKKELSSLADKAIREQMAQFKAKDVGKEMLMEKEGQSFGASESKLGDDDFNEKLEEMRRAWDEQGDNKNVKSLISKMKKVTTQFDDKNDEWGTAAEPRKFIPGTAFSDIPIDEEADKVEAQREKWMMLQRAMEDDDQEPIDVNEEPLDEDEDVGAASSGMDFGDVLGNDEDEDKEGSGSAVRKAVIKAVDWLDREIKKLV